MEKPLSKVKTKKVTIVINESKINLKIDWFIFKFIIKVQINMTSDRLVISPNKIFKCIERFSWDAMNSIDLKKEKVINIVAIDGRFCSLGISKGGKRFLNKSIKKLKNKSAFIYIKLISLIIGFRMKVIWGDNKSAAKNKLVYINKNKGGVITNKDILKKYRLVYLASLIM